MLINYTYKPFLYFLFTFLGSWSIGFFVAYLSDQKGKERFQFPLLFLSIGIPCIIALIFTFVSNNPELIHSFWQRLLIYKIYLASFIMLIVVIPGAFFLATACSLFFGKSREQFRFAQQFNVIAGRPFLSVFISIFLAPLLEELGWRGYGVDSLTAYFNPLTATLLFGALWSLWHLPLCFVKGYYHYELRSLGKIYVANFFISVIPVAILMNWLYFKNHRSILIAILAHALLNALSVLFKTEQLTKCILTIILSTIAVATILLDQAVFL